MTSSTTQTVQSSFFSPCSNPQLENDVFLSFRGIDTRKNFTDHLYRALEGKGIKIFKDDTNLERGNPISLKLLDAIEKSRIAVVILSENYASSTWCLEELVKILEYMEKGGLTVLPIFYHVDPSHVRNQRGTFAVAFAEHENRFQKKKVQIWKNALSDVAKISGKTLTNGPEGEFIREIVDWIFTKLNDKRSIVYEDGFVGMGSRVEEMNSFLDMNSKDVRFIGICGKSGMGKTTLARFVFDKILNQFEACSFLENVKEVSKTRGLKTLQEQLLCDISKGALRIRNVSRGTQVIRNILCDKKVLIVVDDASEKRHLEALAGRSWFGPRSRIIVTTEDECLLKSYEIKTVCKADGLNNVEAQRLFSHKAHCEIDFLDLVNDFVTYAQGNPLVLKVLGSHLCKRTKEEWESAQNQLKAIPNENILEKLQIAYYGLEELEKKLFLHIACFFKGEDQNRVAAILESVCYWDNNIRKLIEKSLITIVGGKLCMHHLIQQMGWKIVCGESMDLGRRSRLWDCTDVLYVLKNNIGTDRIEGMVLNLPPNEDPEELNAEPFSKMNNLKLLKICKLHLPCLGNLSNELLLLEWHEYPLKSLPKSFQPPELVELIMHHSGIKQLASEFSNLPKLKLIDLSDSQNLCQTPNFNGLPNIERLIFQGCTGLHVLHPSVGSLKRLILLNLKDCKCLKNLPHEINLESLKILILSGCSKLKKFPKIGRNMTSMLELYLDGTAVEELPSSMKHLTGLTLLNLQDCKNLSSFPSVICSLISLEILILSGCKGQPPKASYFLGVIPTLSSIGTTLTLPYTYLTDRQPEPELISLVLPESFSGLSSLESLDLSGCNMLDGALPDELSYLSSLTSLNLRNNNFTRLPYSISQLLNLKLLFLDHCSKLQSLPYLPLSTQFVSAQGCTSLENYSNQVVVWSSGKTVFTFINCLDLANDEEGKIVDVSLQDIHFQALWQRYIEDQINQIEGFCLVLPQTEIPECFVTKDCGPSVRIPLPSNLFNNRSWKGIALCVIFVVPKNLKDVSPGQDSKYFREFICHFDIDGDLLNCPLVAKFPKETYVGSFGLWLYVSHARFTAHLDEGSCISSLIRPKRLDIQIKMCGACILYDQDMVKFVQNLRQKNFGSCNDLSRGHEKFIEDHMSNSQSQKLKSLLSRLYQVDLAQNHLYEYIFHQIARPPRWFTCKNLGPYIELQLPPGVHDDSKWLGFTIYALYGIQMQRAGFSYKLDSTIFLSHYSLSASDEVSFAPYTEFSLSGDVFVESSQDSQRLVVFYIPRRVFQLNWCNHIGALFKSSDPGVRVEMCGERLVYEEDVEEFVQTLVEYMLESPDANHQSFSEHLSHQLGMLQGCNHGKHYPCPLPERMPNPMPKLLQEECTLWETFPNQVIAAGTSKNSSPGSINLGISFGNGQCGSNMSGSPECWFKPYLQDHACILKKSSRGSINFDIPFGNGAYGSKESGQLECWFKPYIQMGQFKSLTCMNFRSCQYIRKLSDLSIVTPNIKELDLYQCRNLVEVHDSVGHLDKLEKLVLSECTGLQILSSCLMMKSFKQLILYECRRLEKFPNISHEMDGLEYLTFIGIAIKELPPSFGNLTRLERLHLGSGYLPSGICNMQNLHELYIWGDVKFPKDMEIDRRALSNDYDGFSKYGFRSLTFLALVFSKNSPEIDFILTSCCPLSLQDLLLQSDDFTLPKSILRFKKLRVLHIWDSIFLQEIPKLPESIRVVELKNSLLTSKSLYKLLLQFGRILGFPQNIACLGVRSDILLDSQSSSRLLHQINSSWFHPSKLPEVRTEFNASPYVYRSFQEDDIGHDCHIRVPGNEIPKWFNHQSARSSISLWVGPEFPTFALCVAFCLEDENAYCYVCVVDVFTNGHKQTLIEVLFDNFRRDNRWFYGASHRLMQHIFGNFIQGDWNHVEISCKISSWTSETGGVIAPTIARLGVHVKCICGLQSSVINHETYYSELPMVMENGSDFSLGEPNLEIDSIAGDEFDLGLSSMARSSMNDVSDFNPYPPSKKIGNLLRKRGQIYQDVVDSNKVPVDADPAGEAVPRGSGHSPISPLGEGSSVTGGESFDVNSIHEKTNLQGFLRKFDEDGENDNFPSHFYHLSGSVVRFQWFDIPVEGLSLLEDIVKRHPNFMAGCRVGAAMRGLMFQMLVAVLLDMQHTCLDSSNLKRVLEWKNALKELLAMGLDVQFILDHVRSAIGPCLACSSEMKLKDLEAKIASVEEDISLLVAELSSLTSQRDEIMKYMSEEDISLPVAELSSLTSQRDEIMKYMSEEDISLPVAELSSLTSQRDEIMKNMSSIGTSSSAETFGSGLFE